MTKKRLKYPYLILIVFLLVILPVFTISGLVSSNIKKQSQEEIEVINEDVIDNTVPVIKETVKVIPPYLDSGVKIGKKYYEYNSSEEDQVNSIIRHDSTYIQNNGIDYVNDKEFDVVAILDGIVNNVKEEDNTSTIEITHNNGYTSVYQSLSKVNVKKNDIVTQGQVIGISGTNELDKEMGNHLHFEIYKDSIAINPDNYLNTEVPIKEDN